MLIEIFGYVGSVLVVVSMLMSSIVKLRVINTVGSVISCIYAFICRAYPLALMNICLIVINVYSLMRLLKTDKKYELLCANTDDTFVKHFLNYYENDIKKFFPSFDAAQMEGMDAFVVCCEGNYVGLAIGKNASGVFDMVLDYATPAYRDTSVGQYFYENISKYKINTIRYAQIVSAEHEPYMKKMGFEKEGDAYIRKLEK